MQKNKIEINKELVLCLALAAQYCHNSSFAGIHRQAIADGYSAVDAILSALLIHKNITPPRNHKAKLDKCRSLFPDLLIDIREEIEANGYFSGGHSFHPGCTWDEIEAFYRDWLKARYKEFEGASGYIGKCIGFSNIVFDRALRLVAADNDIDRSVLEDHVNNEAFGYNYSKINEAISDAHSELFNEADQTESLRIKMNAVTNFCDLDVLASDELTRQIICENEDIAHYCASLYIGFTDLIERVKYERFKKLGLEDVDSNASAEDKLKYNIMPDFFLSLKAKYHGMTNRENVAKVAMAFSEVSHKPKKT